MVVRGEKCAEAMLVRFVAVRDYLRTLVLSAVFDIADTILDLSIF